MALIQYRRLVLLVSVLCMPLVAFAKEDPLNVSLPNMPIPQGSRVALMGDRMAINGIPISIIQFSVKADVSQIKQFYISAFKTMGNGVTGERNLGLDTVLTYQLGKYYYSAQLHQQNGLSIGKLVVSPTPGSYPEDLSTSLPIPPGGKVANKVETLDAGRRSETLTIRCNQSLETVAEYMKNELLRHEWVETGIRQSNTKRDVSTFQLGASLLQMTISKSNSNGVSGATQLLINWIQN